MAEYISREAVMQKFADHVKRSNNSDFAPTPTWNEAVQIVEDFPAADVRPVARGKWIDHQEDRWIYAKCSECGTVHDVKSNFCPSCGADMMEES